MLNCGHAVVQRLIVDSLWHWVQDYQVDGFAFLNAEALTHGAFPALHLCSTDFQATAPGIYIPCLMHACACINVLITTPADRDGTVLDAPPLPHEIAADPVLADRRIVAAPADAGLLARSGVRGFPHWAAWSERPAGFAADVVRFLAEGEQRCEPADSQHSLDCCGLVSALNQQMLSMLLL